MVITQNPIRAGPVKQAYRQWVAGMANVPMGETKECNRWQRAINVKKQKQ